MPQNPRFCRCFILFPLFFAPAVGRAQNSVWQGPLPMENQRPYQAIFLHFPAQNPDVLAKKQAGYGVQFDVANNLLIPNISNGASVREDFETGRVRLQYQRGLGQKLEIGAATQLWVRDGGSLDNFISFYHRLFGLEGNGPDIPQGRDNVSRGKDILFFQDASGNGINQGGGFGLGDTTLTLKRQFSDGKFASAARIGLKLPTGRKSKVFGSGGFDFGAGIDARYAFNENLALFGSVAALKFGGASVPNAKSSGAQGGLGLEWKAGRRTSVIAQIDAQSRAVTTGNSFADRTPVLASVGFKRKMGEGRTLWASFSENGDYTNYNAPFFGNIGPDLTFSLGFDVLR